MKDKKRRIEAFSFFDYTGIAVHLSKMAQQGWMIEKITNFGWIYRRIEPRNLTFCVSYYANASEYDPEPTEDQKIFYDFCEHTGWVLAVTFAPMQIFYNEQENPVPIETDPVLEIETIHASAKKRYLPGYYIMLALAVMEILLFISRLLGDLIGLLSSTTNLITGLMWLMFLLLSLIEVCGYFLWHSKAAKAAERGEFVKSSNRSTVRKVILAITLAGFAYWIFTVVVPGSVIWKAAALSMLLYWIALMLLVNGIRQLLKRRKAPRNVNRVVTILSCIVISWVMLFAIISGVLRASREGLFDRDQETYEYNGSTFVLYMDELPLTVEDLLDVEYSGYIRERRSDESLLMGQFVMKQRTRFDAEHFSEIPDLEYTITEIRLPFLYDFCKNTLLNERKDEMEDGRVVFADHYEPADASAWQADEAYRIYWGQGYLEHYLLCYDKRIVEITFSWEPTSEQMAIVADRLSK